MLTHEKVINRINEHFFNINGLTKAREKQCK